MDDFEKNDAYGCITFVRCRGSRRHFLSSVESSSFIEITISHAVKNTCFGKGGFNRDYSKPPIVTVSLSPAQFAELLTTMNVGNGVPCTITNLDGESVLRIDHEENEIGYVQDYIDDRLNNFERCLNEDGDKIDELLFKDKINKKEREIIRKYIDGIRMEVISNIPFYKERIKQNMEKVIAQGKAEIDSFIASSVINTGLESLRNNAPQFLLKE